MKAPIPMESGQVESGSSTSRRLLGGDTLVSIAGAELRRRIARHRALIDEPADIAERVIDLLEPTGTTPGP